MNKNCNHCKQPKPFSDFGRDRNSKDGFKSECKNCRNQKNLESYYVKTYGSKHAQNKRPLEIKSTTKICRVCHKRKEKNSFLKRSNSIDGYRKICLTCHWEQQSVREKKWRANNPERRLSKSIAVRMWYSLKGKKHHKHWEDLVGYNLEQLKSHLESKFLPGMTWDNYGKWHVDHVKPVSSFQITSYYCADFKKCWSLDNLQPLWASDNKSKYNKLLIVF